MSEIWHLIELNPTSVLRNITVSLYLSILSQYHYFNEVWIVGNTSPFTCTQSKMKNIGYNMLGRVSRDHQREWNIHSGLKIINLILSQYTILIYLMHWRHVSITTTPCWGVKTCRATRTCCAGRALAFSASQSVRGPGGMACKGWPAGCMLGDGARGSASFDPPTRGGALLWRHMHKVYYLNLVTFEMCSFCH